MEHYVTWRFTCRFADYMLANTTPTRGVDIGVWSENGWTRYDGHIGCRRLRNALIVTHTGCVWGSQVTLGVKELAAAQMLGPDIVHVHCNALDEQEWMPARSIPSALLGMSEAIPVVLVLQLGDRAGGALLQ
jgi:hypothetical protein